ncbi:T9SS type A sorting domain-containing protein [Lacinutrix sp. Bg11-31]|uniref:T9SS type A sorting domain-containing protein n=1 Tax=Lacinutrix sp. Bg11-31 TaxID=2057808 RepID=UPI000C30CB44|nr:T9SS type A sorting domain-containing protein [Lacinutrix sp. Bg11-31]AUC82800.1 glycosyl hydrolase [Lacinutrix sp. Bg11-31]
MKNLLILFCFFCFTFSQAQYNQNAPWMETINVESRAKTDNPVQFQEVVNAFNTYWETRDPNVKGSGYKPFKRWENHWGKFTKEDGTLPTSQELWNTYLSTKSNATSKSFMADESNWVPVGPFTHTNTGSWSSGQGRVNVIVKDEVIAGTYYVGAPAGGFWKSTDNGVSWATYTDLLPQIGVSGIAIDYSNPGTIYIATGDDDAGDSVSVGVMKSIDGGLNWNTTGLNAGNTPGSMNDIYVSSTNANIVWVATNNGVYKSIDAGTTWSNTNNTQGQNIRDIKINPQDDTIIYAVSSNRFFKSTDGGDSFTIYNSTSSGLPLSNISRLAIDVTPANPNLVYVLASDNGNGFKGIYRSIDSGDTFSTIATPATVGDIFESTQSWYDMAFGVSATNENEIYTGVLNVWKGIVGTNGQATFTNINSWSAPFSSTYTHADIHFIRFYGGELLVGSDGGFYKSDNAGVSFTDLTGGMQIGQFYRIAVSKQSSDKMVGGLQDNGGHAYNNNTWQNYYGADGMDTAVDPANSNIYYGFIQNGSSLYISNTSGGGISGTVGSPEDGNWITPLKMNSDSELFAGYNSVYKLENGAWVQVSQNFGSSVDVLEIDDINPDNMYVGINNALRKSTDRGVVFSLVENFSNNITSIEVNTTNNNIVYVTTSGINGQVYKSIDGGLNFTNISSGLPSVTKNSIKHQSLHSKNPLFLGTSLGVYRYDDDTLAWELFNIGLPNVDVTDIEVNIFDNKITAATYGRGVWQSIIPTELAPTDVKLLGLSGISTAIECDANITPQVEISNNGISTISSVDITYSVDGTDTVYSWIGSLASEATTTVTLPQIALAKGTHTFAASVNTLNDAYTINNNSEEKIILANASAVVDVVNTFETVNEELLVSDDGATTQYWERGVPTGTVLNDASNPTNQVYATNLGGEYIDNTKSYLISECYDLTTLSSPIIQFDMAFQLELDWDIAYMEYSTNQGVNWDVLGTASDSNWYNSSTLPGNNCLNCPGAQWTGQSVNLSNYAYDLTAFTNESTMMFRFVFHSDQSVTEEGVIIDNLVVTQNPLSVDEFNTDGFSVYPNPSHGLFNIKTKTPEAFSFDVYDVTGKLVLQQKNVKTNNNQYKIDITSYASGVYFLNIYNEKSKVTKKLMLN